MKHLDILHDPSRAGDAVADARARLNTTAFRAAVAASAARFAAAGIGRGDVVATVLTNRVELVVALYAAWDLGAVLTPVNPAVTPDEIAYQLSDGGVRLEPRRPTTWPCPLSVGGDPVMGEEPVAFVIPTPGASIDEAELIAHCRDVLARFKVPRAIHAVDILPRNAVGKVTKDVLRRRLRAVSWPSRRLP